MYNTIYNNHITAIGLYYGVSTECARYLYHRAKKSVLKTNDPKYLKWTVELQNAIVQLDRCLGVEWDKILFGAEEDYINAMGIVLDINSYVSPTSSTSLPFTYNNMEVQENGWTLVTKKKKNIGNINLRDFGLFTI